ncbi:LCP family protein [Catellatospora sp. KI3]|uniref:LCP family protein n=1 Tax=Catellatospora sp. KI3 TaxID=3041620 RepID=UPI00248313DC|nr:LCP family protein [Catellatospora sp. KI3]MDI1461740.1 LCP family protein [Catellatospora sp. KI3]
MAKKAPKGSKRTTGGVPRQRTRPGGAGGTAASRKRGRRGRAPLWSKLAVTFGALLMLAAGGAIVGVRSFVGSVEDNLQTANVIDDAAAPEGEALKGAIDMLLLGIDTRAGQRADDARADTIMLLHIPATHDQAYLMSIPRDALVDIPAAGNGYGGHKDKANAAFFFGAQKGGGWTGGLKLTYETVRNLTGIQFDGAAVIDFAGFKQVIEALGSVYLCVEADTKSSHYFMIDGRPQYVAGSGNDNLKVEKDRGLLGKEFVHRKGCRSMSGWEALDFSRIRKHAADGTGDYARQRHQQQLIKAMAKKAASAEMLRDFGKVNNLIKAVGKSMLLDTGASEPIDFLFTMKDLAGADLVLLKTNGGNYNTAEGGEGLDQLTMQMFQAAKTDNLGQFVLMNPELVNNEK